MIVAIDGPSGAGKSTIAQSIAKDLDMIYIDTGAMYRVVTYHILNEKIDPTDDTAIGHLLDRLTIDFQENQILVNNQSVGNEIRTSEINQHISSVSANPLIRHFLTKQQKEIAKKHPSVIMDGRDIGTVVFPDADFKFYITANSEVRAQRRYNQEKEKNIPSRLEDVLHSMQQRDYEDIHKPISPLKKAKDAISIDTTNKTLEESIQEVKSYLER